MPLDFNTFITVGNNAISISDSQAVIDLPFVTSKCIIKVTTSVPDGSNWKFAGYWYQQFIKNDKAYRIDGTRKIFLDRLTVLTVEPVPNSQIVIDIPKYFTDYGVEALASSYETELASFSRTDIDIINFIATKIEQIMGIYFENLGSLTSTSNQTSTTVTVQSTNPATSLLAANSTRKGAVIKNTGNKSMAIGFTNAITSASNFVTIAAGASYSFDINYIGEIFGIAASSTTTVQVTEFT